MEYKQTELFQDVRSALCSRHKPREGSERTCTFPSEPRNQEILAFPRGEETPGRLRAWTFKVTEPFSISPLLLE